MVIVDTSGSMAACTNPATAWPDSCVDVGGGVPNTCGLTPYRTNDAKCALQQTISAFAGQVNFGLATFSVYQSNCPSSCNYSEFWVGAPYYFWYRYLWDGCDYDQSVQCEGAEIVVELLQDTDPNPSPNVPDLMEWLDDDCGNDREVFALGGTPLGGSLSDIETYLQNGFGGYPSPLTANDPGCRSLNIILLTDGGESCSGDPVAAAQSLYNGFTKDGIFRQVYTHVIAFNVDDAADQVLLDDIHKMGQCGATTGSCADSVSAIPAANEVDLSIALADIVSSAIPPETCNNEDDNCNGCVDEGFAHYCHQGPSYVAGADCCDWSTDAQRDQCITNYLATVTGSNPLGDPTYLPCTSVTEQQDEDYWLCYDPQEICDGVDNNCDGNIDEGFQKCGSPLHCPETEVCDGEDNDCDGLIDEENVCGSCVPNPEVCNGCDDDCDGWVDNPPAGGFADIDCGLPTPAHCAGTRSCQAPALATNGAGTCNTGAGYGPCDGQTILTEVCNGEDDDCNGQIDEMTMGAACEPAANVSPHDQYGGASRCTYGTEACLNGSVVCQGGTTWIDEICNGVDDDCDGQVDEAGDIAMVGTQCGSNTGPCTPGTWQCQSGTMVCDGGIQPGTEVCNGVDDDCDGAIDEPPLGDAPAPGQYGCWTLAGSSCSHENLSWDPPAGAGCHDVGTLSSPPCNTGVLSCEGANGWICLAPVEPEAEICDNADNDCDGQVDESDSATALMQDCYSPGLGPNTGCTDYDPSQCDGVCQPGHRICGHVTPGVWSDCVGEVTPTVEVCDGLDNDCDGAADESEDLPWIGQPCPPSMNVCNGILDCQGGQRVCVGGSTQPGRCNGFDDDCDGVTDELDELQQDPLYGQPCGDATGICEEGTYECVGGGWVCVGAVEPGSEVCNGLDDDCDGVVDNQADCPPVGNTDYYCIEGACRPECDPSSEFPCPGGLDCEQRPVDGQTVWVCLPKQGDCGGETCPEGWICENDQCVDPCADVVCDSWEQCRAGVCVDMSCTGLENPCATGEFCVNHECVPDPCLALDCISGGQACARDCDGTQCEAACVDVCDCPAGQRCDAQGQCEPDPCFETNCDAGEACDADTGACEPDPCAQVVCESFERCFEGDCISDPCRTVDCPPFYECVVRPEDSGTGDASPATSCQPDSAYWVPGEGGGSLTMGGGGCACQQTGAHGAPGSLLLGLMLLFWWTRRRPARRAPLGAHGRRRGGKQ